jgi:hypothetical protein
MTLQGGSPNVCVWRKGDPAPAVSRVSRPRAAQFKLPAVGSVSQPGAEKPPVMLTGERGVVMLTGERGVVCVVGGAGLPAARTARSHVCLNQLCRSLRSVTELLFISTQRLLTAPPCTIRVCGEQVWASRWLWSSCALHSARLRLLQIRPVRRRSGSRRGYVRWGCSWMRVAQR